MGKYIYKITNKVNGKVYIGQANNAKRRFGDHCRPSAAKYSNSLIDLAIQKYGKENFLMEIIGFFEDYNQKEKDYIAYYNSMVPNGYNVLEGGDEPPILKGEKNSNVKITEERAKRIQSLLLDYKIPLRNIIKEMGISKDIVRHINEGTSWYNENFTYPLRPKEQELQTIRVEEVKKMLKTTSLPQKEIAEKVGFHRSFVTMINSGKNWYDEKEHYPLRKTNKERAKLIKKLLLTTNYSIPKIAEICGVSLTFVYNVNKGKTWVDSDLKYPIRSFCNDYPKGVR